MLDGKYFKTMHTHDHNGHVYSVVRPLEDPMILFCKKTGTPLASLHLRCQNNTYQSDHKGNRGRAIITKRPKGQSLSVTFKVSYPKITKSLS